MTTTELIQQIEAELVSRDNALAVAISQRDAANTAIQQLQAAIDNAQGTVITPVIAPVIAASPTNPNLVEVITPPSLGDTIQVEREVFDPSTGVWNYADLGWFQGSGSYHPGGRIRIRGVQTEGSVYGQWSNWLEAP